MDSTEDSIYPTNTIQTSPTDCMHVKFIKVKGVNFLICCHVNTCLVYNSNATRLLYKFDLKSTQDEDNCFTTWFSCSSLAYSTDSGEEFIAVGTSDGKIFRVNV